MITHNPKKEFVVNFNDTKVKENILKIAASEPNNYKLIKDDQILNEIRILQKETLGVGYHIDFIVFRLSDSQTKIVIEVSRSVGAINTSAEATLSNMHLKTVSDKLSAFLSGNVNSQTGTANIPKQGCMVVILLLISFAAGAYFLL